MEKESKTGIQYHVCFRDITGIERESEVSESIYSAFQEFIKTERNLERSDERHKEQSELTDETLNNRALKKPKSTEDKAIDKIQLESAIKSLSESQRRRLLLRYWGFTYKEIADIERCTVQAISKSIKIAESKIFLKSGLKNSS